MEYFRLRFKCFVFSILGFLVPEVIVKIIKTEPHNLLFLIVITLLVALAVYLFRFVWVYVLYPYFYLSVSPFQKMISKMMKIKLLRVNLSVAYMH